MKLRPFFTAIFIVFSFIAFAQDNTIDSLKIALKFAKNDTTRCNILNILIESESDDKIWPDYNDQLLKLAEKNIALDNDLKSFYLRNQAYAWSNIGFLAQQQSDPPKAIAYYQKALSIQEKIYDKQGIATSLNNIGVVYDNKGNIPEALKYYHRSLKIREEIKNKYGIAISLNNIGYVYDNQGDISNALEYYHRSLKILEELNDKSGIAQCLNNVAYIYDKQGDVKKALDNYLRSLKIRKEIRDNKGIAQCLNNIGLIYKSKGDLSKASDYYKESLKIYKEIKDKKGMSTALNNTGSIYESLGDLSKALEFYKLALKTNEEINDKKGISGSLGNIAEIILKRGLADEAFGFASRSLMVAKELGYPENIKYAAATLRNIYKKQNKHKEAFEMFELEIQMRDSINNESTKKASLKKQFQYQYEKKAAADSVKNAEEQKVKNAQLTAQNAQLKQEKTQRLALYGGLALMLVFAGFMFNRFKVTQQQKNIITLQKVKVDEAYEELNQQNEEIAAQRDEIEIQKIKVEEHQKEIIDSITYAKRLQEAILPSRDFVTEHLPENFILYKPKDLVAGDFYWMEVLPHGEDLGGATILIAAADSTGHGVPGAMVSVVCSNALNRSLKEFGLTEPGLLLDKTRELVLETFSKNSSDVKDGMDISLLSIEYRDESIETNIAGDKSEIKNQKSEITIKWSGANNPLWYLLPGATELSEIKANKQPIGKTDNPTPFTTHTILLPYGEERGGVTFYLFTDGYADQFGGEKGKKFKYKQLEELLVANSNSDLSQQSEVLNDKFESWKGDLEQVDDVCIIGVRI